MIKYFCPAIFVVGFYLNQYKKMVEVLPIQSQTPKIFTRDYGFIGPTPMEWKNRNNNWSNVFRKNNRINEKVKKIKLC